MKNTIAYLIRFYWATGDLKLWDAKDDTPIALPDDLVADFTRRVNEVFDPNNTEGTYCHKMPCSIRYRGKGMNPLGKEDMLYFNVVLTYDESHEVIDPGELADDIQSDIEIMLDECFIEWHDTYYTGLGYEIESSWEEPDEED